MANTSWMRSFTQRWGKYVIVPLVIAMLTGCEGKGDSSRRAFVEYLNTQIITSPVVGVCELTPAQRQCSGSQKARTRSKKDATPCCVAFYVNYWPECSDLGYG